MEDNTMILAEGQYYSLDCYETQLNNNVLVVGASGSGKTRSIVTPNLLQATGSYVISDPKGNLCQEYGSYLKSRGYIVKKLDFTNPLESEKYNFFRYIHDTQDVLKVAHMLMYSKDQPHGNDPFWDEAATLLLESLIAFLMETQDEKFRNFHEMMTLSEYCLHPSIERMGLSILDTMMEDLTEGDGKSFARRTYAKFRVAADKTLRSILITLNAHLARYDTPELAQMLSADTINISSLGRRKTALFVVVSDTDRSLDTLANVFFSQAMNELCRFSDRKCKDYRLPVPVRFILDDFATNCKIEEFPRMIASFRSRNISTMLMIQAESQLTESYGCDAKTIIGNCDTYIYLGGNDVDTARSVAARCDLPLRKILYMPVGTNWIFRRGQLPVNARNFDLDSFLREKLQR